MRARGGEEVAGGEAVRGFWHLARGLALAGKGKIPDAEAEYRTVSAAEASTPPDAVFQMPINNKTKDILKIAENELGAKIAMPKHDAIGAFPQLRKAVCVQNTLKYVETPD